MLERIKVARVAACGKKGTRAGHLLAKCPPMGTDAAIFWQAAMFVLNPYKVSMMQLLFASPEQNAFRDQCIAYVEGLHSQEKRNLDLDRANLTRMGVW